MGFQRVCAIAEVVEIILQGGLCLLVTTVEIEILRIGESQRVLLRHLHLSAIGIDVAEIFVQLVLFHVDAADDAQSLTRLVGVGIVGHEALQVLHGLVVLVVVVINHTHFHHRLTGIA